MYLGESFEVLETPGVLSYGVERTDEPAEPNFRRGDVNGDGTVNLADALGLLGVLFLRGEPPACPKAADADDDGGLNLSDPVRILLHLFGGEGSLPEPFEICGVDPTPDDLSCEAQQACTP